MDEDAPQQRVQLNRGTTEGADCERCPFSRFGMPNRPVVSEYPDNPAFLVIGEGPGHTEVFQGRPFVGQSGQVVNKVLAKIGRPRDQVYVGNATCCIPPQGSPETERDRAAECCKPRLLAELAMFPGKPILTLGAVAARTVIPKATLDAIDPPETPKALKKAQKHRQQPTIKAALARRKTINKVRDRRLKNLIEHHRKSLITQIKVKHRRRPDEKWLQQEINRVHGKLVVKAQQDAIKEVDLKKRERDAKAKAKAANPTKKKAKRIKLNDIVGTLFDVDCDGSGVRPIIPGIHPAALLRGGGASIGGSHTPDLAFVNLVYDAAKINSLAKGRDIRLKLNVEYELTDQARAVDLFMQVYRAALAEGACSLDLETYVDDPDRHSALMAYVAKIRVLGLATNDLSISLSWDLLPGWCHSLLQLLIGQTEMTYHNGLYDQTVLTAYGFILGPNWFDTLLAHHAAFPGVSHKLQTVAAQFYGVTPWKSEFRNAEEDPTSLAIYNAKDTGSTHALRAPLAMWVKRTDTERVYALDKKMSRAATQMHLAGMPVSREVNSDLLATFSKQVKESRAAVEDVAADKKLREQIWHHLAIQQARKQRKIDPPEFEDRYNSRLTQIKEDPDWKWKIGSGKHIAALLQAMSVPLTATTEGGDISTKKDVLEMLTDVPVIRDILNYREADKLYSTFVWGIFDRHDAKTGEILCYGYADEGDRIHPIWNVHRISGRWASQWPVVSNVPKDKWKKLAELATRLILDAQTGAIAQKIIDTITAKGSLLFPFEGLNYRLNKDASLSQMTRPNLRRQIRARKGRKFVGFDFAQIEARVIALISGDPYLCRIFAEKLDPHIENSRIIWPQFDSLDKDTQKQLREQSKPIGYGAMYLAQVETLHKQMLKEGHNVKLVDVAKAYSKLMTAMAGLVKWQSATIAKASQPPYEIRDFVLGRRRNWPLGQVEGTEAVNFGVQTAAASIMNTGMARIMEVIHEWRDAWAIAQIHDACVFEVWEDDAHAFSQVVKSCFEQEYDRDGRTIAFTIDLKIGDDWSQV